MEQGGARFEVCYEVAVARFGVLTAGCRAEQGDALGVAGRRDLSDAVGVVASELLVCVLEIRRQVVPVDLDDRAWAVGDGKSPAAPLGLDTTLGSAPALVRAASSSRSKFVVTITFTKPSATSWAIA